MMADFLELSGRTVTTANYLALSREGYRLDIGPSRKDITGDRSGHRERTWEQVKRGIPSRLNIEPADPRPLLPTLVSDPTGADRPKRPTPLTAVKIHPPTDRASSPQDGHHHRLAADLVAQTTAPESGAPPPAKPDNHKVACVGAHTDHDAPER